MYAPNNVTVYLRAFAGCLAGLGASGDSTSYARMADAFAQQLDTAWGTPAPTQFELWAIEENSEAVWENRSPLENAVAFTPSAYTGVADGVIELVQQGNAQVINQGVDPNAGSAAALTQTVWWVDPVDGDDSNTGLTPDQALEHKTEILDRWGIGNSIDGIVVTVHYMNPDVDGSDPGIFNTVNLINGALLVHIAELPAPSFTGTLLVVTTKAFSPPPGNALQATFTTTSGAIVPDMILVNSTRGNSRAPAQRILSGSNWQLGQPLAPFVAGTFPLPVEVDTWQAGDTIVGYVPMNVNLVAIGGIGTDLNQSTFGPNTVVQQMTIFAPSGGFDPFHVDFACNPCFVDVVLQRALTGSGTSTVSLFQVFMGCVLTQQSNTEVAFLKFAGGIIHNGGNFDGCAFSNNVIIADQLVAYDSDLDDCELFIDTGAIFNARGSTFIAGGTVLGKTYGPGTYNQDFGGTTMYHETAEQHFYCALTINNSTVAYSSVTDGGGNVTAYRLALTAEALDAGAGATGFGGLAYIPGVGAITALNAAP